MHLKLFGAWPEEHLQLATVVPGADAVWVHHDGNIISIPTNRISEFIAMLAYAAEEADMTTPIEFPVPRISMGVDDAKAIGKMLADLNVINGSFTPREEGMWEDVNKFLKETVGPDWLDGVMSAAD